MVFGNTPKDTRSMFFSSWKKHQQKQTLTALEQQLVRVMLDHPEYTPLYEQSSQTTFPPGEGGIEHDNPFLHLGLHLTIRDQIKLNRPVGILTVFNRLQLQHPNTHYVEHLMMEPLAHCLWESQRNHCPPDDIRYLQACKELISV
jgi:hypothetical protein